MKIYPWDKKETIAGEGSAPIIPKKLQTGLWVWLYWVFRFTSNPIPAFWFSKPTGMLRYRDGRIAEVGVTHSHAGQPVLCRSGMHASLHVVDALWHAPGTTLWKVHLDGDMDFDPCKVAAQSRTYLQKMDTTGVMRAFVCYVLLQRYPDKIRVGHTSINTRTLKKHVLNPDPKTYRAACVTVGRLLNARYLLGDTLNIRDIVEHGDPQLLEVTSQILNRGVVGRTRQQLRDLFAAMVEDEFKKAPATEAPADTKA